MTFLQNTMLQIRFSCKVILNELKVESKLGQMPESEAATGILVKLLSVISIVYVLRKH